MTTDDDRLSEGEVLQLQNAAFAYVRADSTVTLVATVERIVAERVREAERRGAVEALTAVRDTWQWGAWSDMPDRVNPPALPALARAQFVTDWLTEQLVAYEDRLDRDGGA